MTKELFVTCSARDRSCHKWIGRSDGTYEVTEAGAEIELGSKVRLKLKEKALKEYYSKSLLVNAGYIYEADIFSELLKNNPKVPIKLFDDSFLEGLFENPDVDMERALEDFLLEANEELREKRCRAVVKRLWPPELPAFYVQGEGLSFELDLKAGLEDFSFLDGFDDFGGPVGGEQTSALYINCDNRLIRILRIYLPLKIPDYIL